MNPDDKPQNRRTVLVEGPRTLHQRRVARSSDRLGVQGYPGTFPHAGFEVALAICHYKSWRLSANVVPFWTCKVAIEQLALDQEGCGPEQLALNALCPECAGRQVPQSGATCDDMRSIEVLATGLPLHHGAQLAVDITLRSAITSSSHACPNAATVDGAVLVKARVDKERKYTELVNGDRCRLVVVVVGVETGGRWSDEAVTFLNHLASGRPFGAARFSCGDVVGRAMLTVACGRAFAQSLVSAAEGSCGVEGPTPDLAALCGGV